MRQRSKTPSRLAVSDAAKYRFGRCYRQWKAAFKKPMVIVKSCGVVRFATLSAEAFHNAQSSRTSSRYYRT